MEARVSNSMHRLKSSPSLELEEEEKRKIIEELFLRRKVPKVNIAGTEEIPSFAKEDSRQIGRRRKVDKTKVLKIMNEILIKLLPKGMLEEKIFKPIQ